ncbi:sensor histidine kinase [Glycomyces tarimensis]
MSTLLDLPVRDLKRLHRYTYWTLISSGPAGLSVALLFLAGEAPSSQALLWITVAGLFVSLGLATAVLWLFMEHGGIRLRRRLLWTGWAVVAVGFGAGLFETPVTSSWIVPVALLETGRLLAGGPGGYLRTTAISCATVAAGTVALVALGLTDAAGLILALVMVPAVQAGVVCQWWFYEVAERLDEARGIAGELAVAEERLRFAAELHDVQGGHLQVITLKAQLARRLVEADPRRAGAEIEAVEELAREALKDIRAVVSGYHKVTLAHEIDSAARILRSAGIQAAVRTGPSPLDERAEHLLGLLVREATTNMLRHARARAAELAVSADDTRLTVTVANDGAREAKGGPRGNGITMLAERFAEAGGSVDHERRDGRFTLTGTLPRRPEGAT